MTTLTNLLINVYFALTDTLDILMSEVEKHVEDVEHGELRYDIKKAHNLLINSAKDFHKKFDLYVDKARIDCMANKSDYDGSRSDANEFLRLILLYADRCNTQEMAHKFMQELVQLPEASASNEFINKFKLK